MLAHITEQRLLAAFMRAAMRICSYSWLVLSTRVKTSSFEGKSTASSAPAIMFMSSQSFFASASEPVMTRFIFLPLRACMSCALCIWESPVTETGEIFLSTASLRLLKPASSPKSSLNRSIVHLRYQELYLFMASSVLSCTMSFMHSQAFFTDSAIFSESSLPNFPSTHFARS